MAVTNIGRKQRRINFLDAVDERAHRLARSRTALFRVGKVTAVTGNAVTCTVGGGPVDAIGFVGQTLAVGQTVLLGTDTDAWWVIGRLS